MRSYRVDESWTEVGVPVVLIHGHLSTGFFEHLFDDAPARYRLLAPDMRGFGDTERLPIDATRGDDGYPGDSTASAHWPGVAPGTRGILGFLESVG